MNFEAIHWRRVHDASVQWTAYTLGDTFANILDNQLRQSAHVNSSSRLPRLLYGVTQISGKMKRSKMHL